MIFVKIEKNYNLEDNVNINKYKILIFLTLIFFISSCIFAAPKLRKIEGLINSFETLASDKEIGDFELETNGYIKLEQFKKYAGKGKFSCQATFSIPTDFMTTTEVAKVDSWIAAITMSINTLTKLKITDWSIYKKFAVDVYVPDNTSRDFYIKIVDATGKEFIALRPIKAGRNKLEVLLEEVKNARIDLSNIVSFSLYLDTKNEQKDVVLYIDYIRLIP